MFIKQCHELIHFFRGYVSPAPGTGARQTSDAQAEIPLPGAKEKKRHLTAALVRVQTGQP